MPYTIKQLANNQAQTHCVVDPAGKVFTNALMHEKDAEVMAMLCNHVSFTNARIAEISNALSKLKL